MIELFRLLQDSGILAASFIIGALAIIIAIIGRIQSSIDLTRPQAALLSLFGALLITLGIVGSYISAQPPSTTTQPTAISPTQLSSDTKPTVQGALPSATNAPPVAVPTVGEPTAIPTPTSPSAIARDDGICEGIKGFALTGLTELEVPVFAHAEIFIEGNHLEVVLPTGVYDLPPQRWGYVWLFQEACTEQEIWDMHVTPHIQATNGEGRIEEDWTRTFFQRR